MSIIHLFIVNSQFTAIIRLIHILWVCFKWTLGVGVAATIAVCAYLYLRLDDEISRYSEQLLASHYSQFRVQVGGARFAQGRGITIYDLSISDPHAAEAHRILLHIDELQLQGDFGTQEILTCSPNVAQIVVKRPQMFARRGYDGNWNVARLWPLPKFGDCSPRIRIEDASLVLGDEAKPHALPFIVRDVDLEVHQAVKEPGGSPTIQFYGSAGRPLAEKIAFSGEQNVATGQLDASCQIMQLEVTPELLANLPLEGLAEGVDLRGQIDCEIEAHRAAGVDAPLRWKVKNLRLAGGRLSHPRLPRRISELQAAGECDQDGLTVTSCTGKYGTADVAMTCRRTGWHAAAPMVLRARAVNLPLDKQLESALPPSLWQWWDRYRPAGTVTATLNELQFDGSEWRPDVSIECHQVSFADYEKFPYRMQNASGALRYFDSGGPQGAELVLDLKPTMQNREVTIAGRFAGLPRLSTIDAPAPLPTGFLQIMGTKIPYHRELFDAIDAKIPQAASVIRSLNPEGEFSFHWRVERTSSQQTEMATALTLDLHAVRGCYEHFPDPLSNVTGRIVGQGKHWTFNDLTSTDERTGQVVRATGLLEPTPAGSRLQLVIHGTDVPLDNNLRDALKPELKELWTKLKPQGRINFSARIAHETGQVKPSVELVLEDANRQVQIEPECFPYRMERISGRVHVSPEQRVTLTNIRAEHGKTEIITQGEWQPLPSGGWEFRLAGLHVDRLTPSHDLTAAVPRELRKVIEQLKPEGNFAIQGGELRFTQAMPNDPRIDTRWDVILDGHQVDLHPGMPIEDVFGSVRLVGGNIGGVCATAGEMQIDSLVWKNVQFTAVRGPLWCDRSQCLFGQGATQRMQQPSRSVEAQTCGGRLAVNGNVLYDGYTRYGLSAQARDLDLASFTTEQFNGQGELSGKVHGEIRLQGQGNSLYGLEGGGKLTVNDANLYELPLLVSLLKVLRNRAPDSTAFNKVESEFLIHGDRVTLNKLDLLGDAVSFYGRGDAWFNKRIDLTFHSIIGQNELSIPVLKNFVGQASEQFMQLAVDGTLDDPQTHTKAFPGVSNMIEQLQSDLNGSELPASAQQRALSSPR